MKWYLRNPAPWTGSPWELMSSYFRVLKIHPRSTALNYLSAIMQFYFNEFARIYRFPRIVGVGNAVWGVAHISYHLDSGALAISIQSKASLWFPYGWQSLVFSKLGIDLSEILWFLLIEICSYDCRSLWWKGMACPCVLLTRRCMMWGYIEVRLPQFKPTPPTPEFSIARAGIDELSWAIMTHYKSSCVLIFDRWNSLLCMIRPIWYS